MATRPLRSSADTQRRAARAAAAQASQPAQQEEMSARDAKRAPSQSRSAKQRTHAETLQEGSTGGAEMLPEGQQEGAGSAQDSASAAQQGELAELRLLVRQQAQQAQAQGPPRRQPSRLGQPSRRQSLSGDTG